MKAKKTIIFFVTFLLLICFCSLPATAYAAESRPITIEGSNYVAKGKKITLKANQAVTWRSGNKKVAAVSAKGVVKGIKAGKVTITAVSKKKKSVKKAWKITVLKKPVTSVKIKNAKKVLQLEDQESLKLKAVVSPSVSAKCIVWTSSRPDVAAVDKNGKVTAMGGGKTTITASATDGSKKKASFVIQVKTNAKVGVSMPTDEFARWKGDGQKIRSLLLKSGCKADLKYASNDPAVQNTQIEEMITEGCKAIVVAAIDPSSMKTVLAKAKKKGIPVVSYDRLLSGSDAVSCYVTFDGYAVGVAQGDYIKDALKLDNAKGPFNLEITAGDSRDSNAGLFYQGAMSVLKPYIKSGKLVVKSGQSTLKKAATKYWMTDNAEARAKTILKSYYKSGTNVDAWLCPNDSTASGVVSALKANYKGKWPVITGQDCDIENVKNIIAGLQSMSVYKRTSGLAEIAASAAQKLVGGIKIDGDAKTDNGSIKVPTLYAELVTVTKSNYSILIKDGIYPKGTF